MVGGGANYSWEIHELEEMYSEIFGGASNCGNNCMFAIFLRGGGETGAKYHLYSDQQIESHHLTFPRHPSHQLPIPLGFLSFYDTLIRNYSLLFMILTAMTFSLLI